MEFEFELTRQPQVNHPVQQILWMLRIPVKHPLRQVWILL
jgi:hypothetical protein